VTEEPEGMPDLVPVQVAAPRCAQATILAAAWLEYHETRPRLVVLDVDAVDQAAPTTLRGESVRSGSDEKAGLHALGYQLVPNSDSGGPVLERVDD
jgi:hypothetical protein